MEEGLPKNPKLELAQYKFAISQELSAPKPNQAIISSMKQKLHDGIVAESDY